MNIETQSVKTSLGDFTVFAVGGAVCAAGFTARRRTMIDDLSRRFGEYSLETTKDPAGAISALRAYAAGNVTALDHVRVDAGGTEFQRAVWRALRAIRPGTTTTYAAIADAIGNANAVRAVGAANGANPVAVIVPCHRVIGSDGELHGYAGGLARKRMLLEHERENARTGATKTERREPART
jgi:methylated-DNA-[protein]-cysteine S-methyltransferase